uniref:Glycylpeptide N-tetradecanoyltransferase n=2 Tax=Mucochytrium quahogii TaxID=96639 RepID=A0A7S2RFI4_9STRA|mmetsp:Transcript_4154/g.6092  ORF Transcript_4154/g.6092 Transcript_4154/m.6092 type:complete len:452 (+) Transcript_4154:43-1398(+)
MSQGGEGASAKDVSAVANAVTAPDAPQTDVKTAVANKDKAAQLQELYMRMQGFKMPSAPENKDHKFWSTQPVPQLSSEASGKIDEEVVIGPLDDTKTVDQVRQEPYGLPASYEWCVIDVKNEVELKEAYTLLTENYVEDDDNMFRFDYSPEFLRWALCSPGYFKEWHVGVRQSNNKKLRAMITGIPVTSNAMGKSLKMAEINFLCIHKKLRSKRLAPVLIKEVTRRVNLKDQWQAVYTAGVLLPRPVGVARYWHRSLNPKKLISVGFSRIQERMTMARTIKLYSVPSEPKIQGIREMVKSDAKQVQALLAEYLKQHKVFIEFDVEEVEHWFTPRKDVIYSYVVEKDGKVTDFCSFYNLPSTVIGHPQYNHLKAAYCFYNVANTVPLKDLMNDALIFANREKFDVFNALDIMQNATFLKELKFGIGDGNLHYYFYNFQMPTIKPNEIGIVLL